MPKPVLSDSLFNADNVATAVLAEANLQISNSVLGVTDISSDMDIQSGFTGQMVYAFAFNGFVFYNAKVDHSGGTPSNDEKIIQMSNSTYHANQTYLNNSISYEGDFVNRIEIRTDGGFYILNPDNTGNSTFVMAFNGWYRYA